MKKQEKLGVAVGALVLIMALFVGCPGAGDGGGETTVGTPAKPTGQVVSVNSVKISWTGVSGAAKYSIYRTVSSTGTYRYLDETEELSYTDTGLTANSKYYYKIRAVGSDGVEGAPSDYVEVTTTLVTSAPAAVTVTGSTKDSITLMWTAVSGASEYKIYFCETSNGQYSSVGTTRAVTYTHDDLTPATTFYYRVSAVSNGEESAKSSAYAKGSTKAENGSTIEGGAPDTGTVDDSNSGNNGSNDDNGSNTDNGSGSQTDGTASLPSGGLATKLAFIANRADNGVSYDIVVTENEYLDPTTIATRGKNVSITIRSASASASAIKSISLENPGNLFAVANNITLTLKNIVLKGVTANTVALVEVSLGATLILDSGAKITLNTNTTFNTGGGIYLNGGAFTMNDGSEISGNSTRYGGGIFVANKSTATITGGTISSNNAANASGGGIYISNDCTVTMNGGIISNNSATSYGGGVYIQNTGTFIKRHATGKETSGTIYGATGDGANSGQRGAALYRETGTKKQRNATLGEFDEITSKSDEGWEE
jgi:hypothetical protein